MANAAAVAATASSTIVTDHTAMASELDTTAAETAVAAALRQELQQSANFYY